MLKTFFIVFTLALIVAANGCGNSRPANVSEPAVDRSAANTAATPAVEQPAPAVSDEPKPPSIPNDREVEGFIRDEVAGRWLDRDGAPTRLTKDAERDLLGRLIPAGRKQWVLSYAGQVAMDAETVSESNVTTTTVEGGGVKTTTKTYRPGEGDRKLAIAADNLKLVPPKVCGRPAGSAEPDPACVANVRRILTTIDKSARRQADHIMEPLMKKKTDAAVR